jgi:excisionase family DNA binding protein
MSLTPAAQAAVDEINAECDSTGAYFISIPEAARRLGVGKSSGYELVASGQLATVRYGQRRLVPVSEVRRLAAKMIADAAS